MSNETQSTIDSAKNITASDIIVYEARLNQMLAAVTEQRDDAQFKFIGLRGEVAALGQRLKNAGDVADELKAQIEQLRNALVAEQEKNKQTVVNED